MALRKGICEFTSKLARSSPAFPGLAAPASTAFSRAFATVLDDCKYAESHEWARMDGDVATIGISDFAQSELGDVVYVELPAVGETLNAKDTFGVVESVKTASDVYMPVSGEVVEANEQLSSDPGLVNSGAFTEGWLIKVKLSNKSDLESLLDSSAYKKLIEDNN